MDVKACMVNKWINASEGKALAYWMASVAHLPHASHAFFDDKAELAKGVALLNLAKPMMGSGPAEMQACKPCAPLCSGIIDRIDQAFSSHDPQKGVAWSAFLARYLAASKENPFGGVGGMMRLAKALKYEMSPTHSSLRASWREEHAVSMILSTGARFDFDSEGLDGFVKFCHALKSHAFSILSNLFAPQGSRSWLWLVRLAEFEFDSRPLAGRALSWTMASLMESSLLSSSMKPQSASELSLAKAMSQSALAPSLNALFAVWTHSLIGALEAETPHPELLSRWRSMSAIAMSRCLAREIEAQTPCHLMVRESVGGVDKKEPIRL